MIQIFWDNFPYRIPFSKIPPQIILVKNCSLLKINRKQLQFQKILLTLKIFNFLPIQSLKEIAVFLGVTESSFTVYSLNYAC